MSETEALSDEEGASLFGGNLATLESNAKRHLLELGSALADAPDAPSGAPNLAADEPTLIPIARVSPVSIQNKRDRESHSSVSPPRRQPRVASASPPCLLPTTKAIPPHMPSSLHQLTEVWATRPWATEVARLCPCRCRSNKLWMRIQVAVAVRTGSKAPLRRRCRPSNGVTHAQQM